MSFKDRHFKALDVSEKWKRWVWKRVYRSKGRGRGMQIKWVRRRG